MTDLAGRAVARKGWRVMEGMLDESGDRVISIRDHFGQSRYFTLDDVEYEGTQLEGGSDASFFRPDFEDPATIGCLEHLVREAWADWEVDILVSDTTWSVWSGNGAQNFLFEAPTLAESLVLALEAAP